jgi:hypothetical protein
LKIVDTLKLKSVRSQEKATGNPAKQTRPKGGAVCRAPCLSESGGLEKTEKHFSPAPFARISVAFSERMLASFGLGFCVLFIMEKYRKEFNIYCKSKGSACLQSMKGCNYTA